MLTTAVELFRARGYEGVGVAELLAKANAAERLALFPFSRRQRADRRRSG